MNKVFLIGNLTADPQGSSFDSGHTNCRFSIAVNRSYRGSDGNNVVDFINIVAWDALAQNCIKYLQKGSKVAVTGSIQTGSYERDGVRRQTVDIRADQVEFLNRPGTGANAQGQSAPQRESIDSLQEVAAVEDDMPF